MDQDYLCISIPTELQQYTKIVSNINDNTEHPIKEVNTDFGVKLIKDDKGNLIHAAYYSESGELLKKIFYDGPTVSSIEHYRYNLLCSIEKYNNGKITRKTKFNRFRKPICIVNYEYNRKDQITAIRKFANDNRYEVEYGYDELMRVNSRIIKVNNNIVTEQRYRYDILDRIVEYKDENQTITVKKLNPKNELLSYSITDKVGNTIIIINKYLCSDYIGTEIELNGHKTTVCDKSYVDNIMLKKPFTSEDDLDLVMSKMIYKNNHERTSNIAPITKRTSNTDITNVVINENINISTKPLPISMRKLRLLQIA